LALSGDDLPPMARTPADLSLVRLNPNSGTTAWTSGGLLLIDTDAFLRDG
jgi:hypothetical protein